MDKNNSENCMFEYCENKAEFIEYDDSHWHDWLWCKRHLSKSKGDTYSLKTDDSIG